MSLSVELPGSIILFAQALRDKNMDVATDSILVALKSLELIDIKQKTDFYNVLKANLVSRREDAEEFDRLFAMYWNFSLNSAPSVKEITTKNPDHPDDKENIRSRKIFEEEGYRFRELSDDSQERSRVDDQEKPSYSPIEVLKKKDFSSMQAKELEEITEYILTLYQKIALIMTRRWKKGRAQRQIDFRRTIRQAVRFGGDILDLKWKQRRRRPVRIVLLCDISGSMNVYGQFVLLFMYAMQRFYRYCETFVFATRLTNISDMLQNVATFSGALQFISREVLDWSGGTNIGEALYTLRTRYRSFLHPNRTVIIVFSDGWEKGDAHLLDQEMRYLKRLSRSLVWLNPHLADAGYQPLCKGMATALPYLDHFLPCHNFSSLRYLGNLVSHL